MVKTMNVKSIELGYQLLTDSLIADSLTCTTFLSTEPEKSETNMKNFTHTLGSFVKKRKCKLINQN